MKKLVIVSVLGLFAATGAFAQEGELVSVDAKTDKAYYTYNQNYNIESDGSYSGNIAAYFEDGSIEEVGVLNKGAKTGKWLKYNSEGKVVASATFKDGKKDDVWKVWDGNGQIRMTMQYDEGKRVGTWKFYDESGKLLNEKTYE